MYRELFEAIVAEADNPAAAYVDFFTGAAAVLEESDFIDPCPIGTIAREVANTSEPLREAAKRVFDSWIAAAHAHLTAAGIPSDVAGELATALRRDRRGHVRTEQDTANDYPAHCRRSAPRRTRRNAMTEVAHSHA